VVRFDFGLLPPSISNTLILLEVFANLVVFFASSLHSLKLDSLNYDILEFITFGLSATTLLTKSFGFVAPFDSSSD